MRISDWSSDVCSSDLGLPPEARRMSIELTFAFAPAALLTLVTGISAARLRAHERHINTLLDSVPAVVILTWVLLAATVNDIGPLLWGTLVGYLIQSAWLLWLASRSEEHTSELQSLMR